MAGRLQGKTVLITGTSPNIGGGLAEGMAAEGAAIVCVDVDANNAEQCAADLRRQGHEAMGLICNVTDEGQVRAAVADAEHAFGGIDVLVNNAVVFNQKGVLDMPLEEFEQQIGVILSGAFLFTKHVAHAMIDRQAAGAIINVISTAGHQGQPGNVGYCTGKSGLLNFTRSVAMELAPYNIRVNSLTPTATDPEESMRRSERWGRGAGDPRLKSAFEGFRRGVPMQRLPSPSDYARAAVFLASDDSLMMTGADLRIDAGAVSRYWAWNPA